MQPVEERMIEYLRERVALLGEESMRFAPFRSKFYADGCRRDTREHLLKESQSERILKISVVDLEAEVITGIETSEGGIRRLRYQLKATSDAWMINSLEIECPSCLGQQGNRFCGGCCGTGWLVRLNRQTV